MSFLSVNNLCITHTLTNTLLVKDLSFNINLGEVLGIIGESGSGKSLTCKAVLGLLPAQLSFQGSITLDGEELLETSFERLRQIRLTKISTIFQDAMNAFDPLYTIGTQTTESLQESMSKKQAKILMIEWFEKVGLPSIKVLKSYPHELSGGMLQRVMIALSLAKETPLIIADEPTSALDVITQKEIIKLFQTFTDKNRSLIFVSHDLGITSHLADNILVMQKGKGVEYASSNLLFNSPKEEYTKYLISRRQALSERFLQCFA